MRVGAMDCLLTLVLSVLAYDDIQAAVDDLSLALTQGQAVGFIRTFVDVGQPLVTLL